MNNSKKPFPLIINSPLKEPSKHWKFDKTKKEFVLKDGRRPASYIIASSDNKNYDDYGAIVEIPLVNNIRERIKEWEKANYPGVTGITKRLLDFWHQPPEDSGRKFAFFFCQLEAIKTLIFLVEAPAHLKVGLNIPKDESLNRLCTKMATGTGKTVVMAMTIAWQILNKATYPRDTRFSKNVFVVAPNLTVKDRLSSLEIGGTNNYYQEFKIIPNELTDKINSGHVLIKNWHQLQWETEEKIAKKTTVDKRGAKSDAAYVKETLEHLANQNIVVINDEAHHAWRKRNELKIKRTDEMTKDEVEQATKWIEGLDRINRTLGIINVFDFSATPYAPAGKKADEKDLFKWIISDFGLTDAIEAGLVKTPRFAIGDDASADIKNKKARLYHIYDSDEVRPDLNRAAKENESLPDIVKIAYSHLSHDWDDKFKLWHKKCKNKSQFLPPVMISIVNRKETADRIEFSFKEKNIPVANEFNDSSKMIKIYSDLESSMEKSSISNKAFTEETLAKLHSIGRINGEGQSIHHIIAVAMLSEGWDCKTVTHIMGLRAFSSQLLCEQTVGRGLRRTSYDLNEEGMFEPEYVSVLGVPFSYLPQEGNEGPPKPEIPKDCIFPEDEKIQYQITWPNVQKVQRELRPKLTIDFKKIELFKADVSNIPRISEIAPVIDNKPRYEDIKVTDLQKFFERNYQPDRMQTLILKMTGEVYAKTDTEWKNKISKKEAIKQIFVLVEKFVESKKFQVIPEYEQERKDLIVMIKMNEIVNKVFNLIHRDSIENTSVIYANPKFSSTKDCKEWWTKKSTDIFKKTHMNLCVVDSGWERTHAVEIDKNEHVLAWVKNDHLGFEIDYIDEKGKQRSYTPDFIIKLVNGDHIILEVKGIKKKRDIQKWDFMNTWCKAVTNDLEQNWYFKTSTDSTGGIVHRIIDEIINN